jgi:hypothetical protein
VNYRIQLKWSHWQRRKLHIMQRDGFKCTICGNDDTILEVHHHQYSAGKKAWEYLDDNELTTLCDYHHGLIHGKAEYADDVLSDYDVSFEKDVPRIKQINDRIRYLQSYQAANEDSLDSRRRIKIQQDITFLVEERKGHIKEYNDQKLSDLIVKYIKDVKFRNQIDSYKPYIR